MAKFSRALARSVMDFAKALLTPSRGRHSARRRRSTRVRRYAHTLPPATRTSATPERPLAPRTRPAPTPACSRAEEPALVRPYYRAHEQELRRVQQRANTRLHAWTTKALAPIDEEPLFTPLRPLPSPRVPEPPVPGPRIPSPRVPAKFDELTHLSRLRQRQQHRLATTGEVAP